mmetsp:Transcript_12403/g.23246  ORF Transcript_12403/g.23246 Transcript_12403/m.23246 type:complete len:295 (+) Transcript_12403:94-978(+)
MFMINIAQFVLSFYLFQKCHGLLSLPFTSFKTRAPVMKGNQRFMGGYDATIGADPSTPLQFFTLPGNTCPYAQRTLITLYELGIPFDVTEVSGRPMPDWYLKINPRGKVPAIRIPTCDYEVVYESAICNEFLCDYATHVLKMHQELMPQDPMMRARIRLLNDHCDNIFSKTQFTYLMNKEKERDIQLANDMEEALMVYEKALDKSGGPYLLGNQFTLADLHVLPFIQRLVVSLRHWKDYKLPQDKFPRLLVWFSSCLERESVKTSSMDDGKIIEVYQRFMDVNYSFGGLNKNQS